MIVCIVYKRSFILHVVETDEQTRMHTTCTMQCRFDRCWGAIGARAARRRACTLRCWHAGNDDSMEVMLLVICYNAV